MLQGEGRLASPLRELLEQEAGWEDIQLVVPHPFLPPRLLEKAKNRNMIILLDQSMTLHIRWEGSRMHEHLPLTPRATRRLVLEVLDRMAKYRREIKVFSTFIERWAEEPFDDARYPDPVRWKKKEMPTAARIEEEQAQEVIALIEPEASCEAERSLGRGGESPMGEFDE